MTGSNSRQSPASDTSSTGVATAPGYHKPSSELQQQQQQQQQQSRVIPEQRANILSRLFFEWLTPTLWLGYKRPLEQGDLYELDETLQSNVQTERVENELDKERAKPNPSLFKALWRVHGRMFILAAIIKLVWAILQCTAPLVVGKITSFIMECYAADKAGRRDLAPEAYKGYLYALGYVAMLVVASFCNNHSFHLAVRTAIHLKTTVITLVFRKSLVVSNRARETVSTGKVINMMSSDSGKIEQAMFLFHNTWTAIFQVAVSNSLMPQVIGSSGLTGTAMLVLYIPIQVFTMAKFFSLIERVTKVTDERVKVTREVLQGIRIIKYYAWEDAFISRIAKIRSRELSYLRRIWLAAAAIVAIIVVFPTFAAILTFSVYALRGNELDPSKIFSAFAMFQAITLPLHMLPFTMNAVIAGRISYKRVADYLLKSDEVEPQPDIERDADFAIKITDGSFTWEVTRAADEGTEDAPKQHKKKSKQKTAENAADDVTGPADNVFKLPQFSLTVKRGSLVAVVGSVGSGKSSLLAAMIGEMRRTGGTLQLGGTLSYAQQTPWIQNATVRDNILFGRAYDEARYNHVVKVCELERDFQVLPAGDATEIGEKGVNLSGGQKHRVSLARSVYFDADTVLLDDPLSAVDAHVGKALFDNCISAELKSKTRILVTHHLHLLPHVDRIMLMEDGVIAEDGTLDELIARDGKLAALMREYGGVIDDSEENSEADADAAALEAAEAEDAFDDNMVGIAPIAIAPRRTRTGLSTRSKLSAAEVDDPTAAAADGAAAAAAAAAGGGDAKKPAGELMQEEDRETGAVGAQVYKTYAAQLGGWLMVVVLLVFVALTQVTRVGTDLWLSHWTAQADRSRDNFYIGIYVMWGVLQAIAYYLFMIFSTVLSFKAAQNMHNEALKNLMATTTAFFDTTPLGRLVNRFSKDTETMDVQLPENIRGFLECISIVISSMILVAVAVPVYLAVLVPMLGLYFFASVFFRSTSRELKRLDSVTRSPLYAHFSESLTGTATVRAYRVQDAFIKANADYVDDNMRAYYLLFAVQRWLSIRLENISNMLGLAAGMFVISSRFTLSPGLAGLILSYSLSLTANFNWAARQMADVENSMASVERLGHYVYNLDRDGEHPFERDENNQLVGGTAPPPKITAPAPAGWPATAEVEFRNVQLRYRPELPLVLKGVSLRIASGEKVGIVGRTAAGKSSLIQALFRMCELSGGSIVVDGVDISTLDVRELRRAMAIIPQDPVLFQGTVRSNLDPFGKHSDDELWSALDRAGLKEHVMGMSSATAHSAAASSAPSSASSAAEVAVEPKESTAVVVSSSAAAAAAATATAADITAAVGLDAVVQEGGSNFSTGQRQLLCLARATLIKARIVLLDEATANVDAASDARVQQAIRTDFKDCTVITIAHRLNTIADNDKVLVMSYGEVAEFGAPADLLRNSGSMFSSMVEETGPVNAALIRQIAGC